MSASRAHQVEVAERRAKLLRLRRQGVRFDDDRILNLGYANSGAARKDLARALKQARDEEKTEVSIYRQQENERLDALLEAAWPQATERQPVFDKEGEIVTHAVDMRAVDTVLRLMDRRAKLNGLDMPAKAELSGPGGGSMQISTVGLSQLRDLINAAGDPDDDQEDDGDDGFDTEPAGDADDDSDNL